jgi:hypothetical protein
MICTDFKEELLMKRKNKMATIMLLALVFCLMAATPALAYRQIDIHLPINELNVTVNGTEVALEVPSRIVNDRTMVPVSFLTRQMGFPVRWDELTRQVYIGEQEEIVLTIDSSTALMDGELFELDAPAMIENGRTLVPLSFISRALGADVEWNGDTRSVTVHYAPQLRQAVELFTQPVEGETDMLAAINPRFGWDIALALGEIGSYADGLGFRMGGTDAGREASMLVHDAFVEIGLEPTLHPFEVFGWNPIDASMVIHELPAAEIPVVPAPGPAGTDAAGITAELVYVGNATREELDGVDLTGKIALVAWNEDYISWIAQIGHQVRGKGAVGALYFAEDGYGQDPSGEAFFVADWSGADIDIPVWNTPKRYGEMLAEILADRTLTATLVSQVEIEENAVGYNVVAMIPGTVYPDEYVIVNAHTDAYFQGFMDDSLPIGLMMSIAKGMVDSNYEPDRTIVFVAHDAEEFGAMDTAYDWLIGSWALLGEMNEEWAGQTVACITLELLGYEGTQQLPMRSSDTLYFYLQAMTEGLDTGAFEVPGVEIRNTVGTWSDEWSYSYHGIPTMRTHTDYNITYNFYHSQLDQADRVSFGKYIDNLNAYATLMMRFDKMPLAPYDLARTPQIYLESLNTERLTALGLGSELEAAAATYQERANLVLDHLIEATALIQASETLPAEAVAMLPSINQALRNAAKLVITESQYLSQESPAYRLPFYQDLPHTFQQAVSYLQAGDGVSVLGQLSFQGKYYAHYYDYETWYDAYRAAIDWETLGNDLYWSEGRLLKFYNHYHALENIREKILAGETDFSEETAAFSGFRMDAERRLRQAYQDDLNMWYMATMLLPTTQLETLIDLLQ